MNSRALVKGFKKPKGISYEKEDQTPNYGRFVIYPFERGFGHTIGNTFRRILLSSIPGYAISALVIKTKTEKGEFKALSSVFEPIPEVLEETHEVISNLKNVKLKLIEELESKTIKIEKKGNYSLMASDLQVDDTIEVFNKDLH
nr:DNA-directed RNA polymerase subunit alpha [Spirochaetota bacterium]